MRTLAIDTSSEACSVALFEGVDMIGHGHDVIGRGHAERLVPMIAALPDRGQAQRIRVSLGPGSFTGVRIGLATARALGIAWQAEVTGFGSLALLAAIARRGAALTVTACIHGGHGEWFVQRFNEEGQPRSGVQALSPDAASRLEPSAVFVGNRAEDLAKLTADLPEWVVSALPDARHVMALPDGSFTHHLTPIYVRAPDPRLPQ